MRALVVLTAAESKKLIAKAVVAMDEVKRARESGAIVIHPSSSTYFLVEELTGSLPTGVWVCGVVIPRGMCSSRDTTVSNYTGGVHKPKRDFAHAFVIRDGKAERGIPLHTVLDSMGPDDVYVKGCNTLDPEGNVGVLVGDRTGGTIAIVVGAAKRRGFKIIAPTHLGKLIPVPIRDAADQIGVTRLDKVMGKPVSLMRIPATVVTEIEAVKILTGAEAVPVASGGLGGAEGALSLALSGTTVQVEQAYALAESVKGAQLPSPYVLDCRECPSTICHFYGRADGGWIGATVAATPAR